MLEESACLLTLVGATDVRQRHPRPLLVAAVPLLWSMIGGTAAILLDVPQDWGLFAAGAMWVTAYLSPRGERRSGTMAT